MWYNIILKEIETEKSYLLGQTEKVDDFVKKTIPYLPHQVVEKIKPYLWGLKNANTSKHIMFIEALQIIETPVLLNVELKDNYYKFYNS